MFYVCNMLVGKWVDVLDTSDDIIERVDWNDLPRYAVCGLKIKGLTQSSCETRLPHAPQRYLLGKPTILFNEIYIKGGKRQVSGVFIFSFATDLKYLAKLVARSLVKLRGTQSVSEIDVSKLERCTSGYMVDITMDFSDISMIGTSVDRCWCDTIRIMDIDSPKIKRVVIPVHNYDSYISSSDDDIVFNDKFGNDTLWMIYKQVILDGFAFLSII